MMKEYPKFKPNEIKKFANKLSKEEKALIARYLTYRKARGLNTAENFKGIERFLLQVRYILDKPLDRMNLNDLRNMLALINGSNMSNNYKNNIKAHLKNFLKFAFPDWSIRFSNLEDVKTNQNGLNEEKINHKTTLKKEEIIELVKAEMRNYWRAFLLVQYEAGLRTKEVRFLKWEDIKLDIDDGLTEINIFATKTHKARVVYVKEATHYLKLLKQEQENMKDKGVFIFHAKTNKNEPVAKYSVNEWFRKHTKKVLGRECWNYLLRHSRATELYTLAEENKISKDTAIRFMGHSEDMSKTYKHPNPDKVKKMLREQVYHIEDMPEERKHKLELKIEQLERNIEIYRKGNENLKKLVDKAIKLVENQK